MLFGCANYEQSMTTRKSPGSYGRCVKIHFAPMPNFIRHNPGQINPGQILTKKKPKKTKATQKAPKAYIFVEFTKNADGTADMSYFIADRFHRLEGDRYSKNNSNSSLFNTPISFDDSLSVIPITRGGSKGEVKISGADPKNGATHVWVSLQKNDPDKDVTWQQQS
jgi:hypothetical protein